jgi:SPP1 gp7 family putative phage head morphogenesis protein
MTAVDEAGPRYARARKARAQRNVFGRVRRVERFYASQLRAIARQCGLLSRLYDPERPETAHWLVGALREYAEGVQNWAEAAGVRMLEDVARRDAQAWARHSENMSVALRREVQQAPTGELMRALLQEQVGYITSIPREAAARVQELAVRAVESGGRADDITEEILRTGEVAESRARLIARTEVARAASKLTEARARYVGSEGYIWRTSEDADVRPQHRALNGKYFRWDDPPVAGSSGERAHAGQIYNCRCNPEPVVPEYAG